jgi:2-oxoglutarate ferredoxin oxidoreductase subunit alpha
VVNRLGCAKTSLAVSDADGSRGSQPCKHADKEVIKVADEIATADPSSTPTEELDKLVIRFAGDSGDGMQLAGNRFTDASALFGNDLATLPSFPAEIRAPAGTLPGVSSFQVQIADFDILTAGDAPDCLVAMNPAALMKNLKDLRQGGTLIVNTDTFEERNLAKAGYETSPLDDESLQGYRVIKVPMDRLTKEAVKDTGVSGRNVLRSKNFFALGLMAWLFHRPTEPTIEWIDQKFAKLEEVANANKAAFQAGYTFGVATEATKNTFDVKPAALSEGTYTNVNGNTALAWGLIAAAKKADLPLFYGTYPITPASDILHELSRRKNFGVRTFQAEDEIAGVGSAVGAAFAGNLAVTGYRPQVGDDLPLLHARVADDRRQRAERWPFNGSPDQARAVRSSVLAVRASWRVTDTGVGDRIPVRSVHDGYRGRPHRRKVHDTGHPDE